MKKLWKFLDLCTLHIWQNTYLESRTTLETFVTSSGVAKEGPHGSTITRRRKGKVLSTHTAMLIDFLCPSTFAAQGFQRMLSGCSVLRQEEHGRFLLVSIRWQMGIATVACFEKKSSFPTQPHPRIKRHTWWLRCFSKEDIEKTLPQGLLKQKPV